MQLSTRAFATVPQHDDNNNYERGDNGTGRGKQQGRGVLGARAAKADGAEAAGVGGRVGQAGHRREGARGVVDQVRRCFSRGGNEELALFASFFGRRS